MNSVPALQCVSLEILQAEFGTQTAKIMQNLSCGIDDSKVVKTGQPQVSSLLSLLYFYQFLCTDFHDNVASKVQVQGQEHNLSAQERHEAAQPITYQEQSNHKDIHPEKLCL